MRLLDSKRPLSVQCPRKRARRLLCWRFCLAGICAVISSIMGIMAGMRGDGIRTGGAGGRGEPMTPGGTIPAGICRWTSRPMMVRADRDSSSCGGSSPFPTKPNLVFEPAMTLPDYQAAPNAATCLLGGCEERSVLNAFPLLRVCVDRANLRPGQASGQRSSPPGPCAFFSSSTI